MPMIVSASNKESAIKLIVENQQELSEIIKLTDGCNDFIRYLTSNTKQECLKELEQEPEQIHGDWCFLFTGQGVQTPNMMRTIYDNVPTFKENLDRCFDIYKNIFDLSLKEVIFSESDAIHATNWTQPALFAVEYAMAMNWISLGLKPKYVLGHSVGEYPAAVIAGVMTLETGMELIGYRGQMMQSVNSTGSMAALMSEVTEVQALISNNNLKVDIAGINSKIQTVVSGDCDEVRKLILLAKEKRIKAKELVVSHAFHSSHMDPILKAYAEIADNHKFIAPRDCTLISNISGKPMIDSPNGKYWSDHIRSAVNFVDGILFASDQNVNFIEVGPHPILSALGAKTVEKNCLWLESHNNKKGINAYMETLGKLINSGVISSI